MAYRIFNTYIGIVFNIYKYYITNDFKKLLMKKNNSENISMIITPILVRIEMHIKLTGFLDNNASYIVFNPNKKIQERFI